MGELFCNLFVFFIDTGNNVVDEVLLVCYDENVFDIQQGGSIGVFGENEVGIHPIPLMRNYGETERRETARGSMISYRITRFWSTSFIQ